MRWEMRVTLAVTSLSAALRAAESVCAITFPPWVIAARPPLLARNIARNPQCRKRRMAVFRHASEGFETQARQAPPGRGKKKRGQVALASQKFLHRRMAG